eukprot:c7237_g1_i1.p1 GENE.c7237_g1_i1~~c7237_g1_i1.p1  ORF type:complete len:363 (+),score=104.05 c7237_g1_i1:80-1168(+)
MFGLFSSRHKNYKPLSTDSSPPSNMHHSKQHHRTQQTSGVARCAVLGLALTGVVLLFFLAHKQDTAPNQPITRLQRALTIAEESTRILLDKHRVEMKTNLLELEQKEFKIGELETQITLLQKEIDSMACEAGRVELAEPQPETLRSKDYTLPPLKSNPGLVIMASMESEPGLNHIVGQYTNDQYHISQLDLTADDVVFDIGAHVGCFALSVAKLFPETRVVAVEPLPPNFYFLKQNVERLQLKNVVLVNKGLSSHAHAMRFWLNPGNTGGSSAFEPHDTHEFCVPTTTLSNLLTEFAMGKKNVVVNMDCEGCEFDTMLDAPYERITNLQVETHQHMQHMLPKKLKDRMNSVSAKVSSHQKWY